ncbi:hypothetical protein H1Q63_20435 [Desmonostoc muscorum CCALA 125]|nr:hypothetical protein [Desmonostoc muscorum CCALA 125]
MAAIEYKKVDIVALALAKKKIQEIVEREWLLTKKGKTRSAMARWKGIGREGFNRDKPEDTITATTLTTSINHLIEDESNNSSMAGISDIGSAFNLSESSQLNEKNTDNSPSEVELNQELYLNSTDVNLKIPKKRKHTRKQQSLSQVEQTVSINDKAADEWKPDLSGWDISIGLPESNAVFNFNSQLSRRFTNRYTLSPFEWKADSGKEFRTFIHAVESQLPLSDESCLASEEMSLRFYYASDGVVAYVMKLIRYGTYLALSQGLEKLDLNVLATAFDKYVKADKLHKHNPFLTDEYLLYEKQVSSLQEFSTLEATNRRIKPKTRSTKASDILHK